MKLSPTKIDLKIIIFTLIAWIPNYSEMSVVIEMFARALFQPKIYMSSLTLMSDVNKKFHNRRHRYLFQVAVEMESSNFSGNHLIAMRRGLLAEHLALFICCLAKRVQQEKKRENNWRALLSISIHVSFVYTGWSILMCRVSWTRDSEEENEETGAK